MAVDLQDWSNRLISAARTTLPPGFESGGLATLAAFSDELGDRRQVDEPLLAWVLGVTPRPTRAVETADVLLWRSLAQNIAWDERLLHAARGLPLLDLPERTAIEVATEAELSALHALWQLGRRDHRQDVEDRCLNAAAEFMDQVQPDNATNHPWAVHVFLIHAHRTGQIEGQMYAETMMHNCQVGRGRPDLLSAVILLDAGRALAAMVDAR